MVQESNGHVVKVTVVGMESNADNRQQTTDNRQKTADGTQLTADG
jgi:hypothetical protein